MSAWPHSAPMRGSMLWVEDLYAKYPDIDALANATPEEIEEIVRPCGLGKSKARDINACMRMLRDEYHSQVPDDFNALLKLPGVGRKSANLIMGDVFKKPAIVTDTHCIRLCNRIGLVHDCKDPKKVEMALWKIVPPEEGARSATGLWSTDARSVLRGRHRTVNGVCSRISVRRTA